MSSSSASSQSTGYQSTTRRLRLCHRSTSPTSSAASTTSPPGSILPAALPSEGLLLQSTGSSLADAGLHSPLLTTAMPTTSLSAAAAPLALSVLRPANDQTPSSTEVRTVALDSVTTAVLSARPFTLGELPVVASSSTLTNTSCTSSANASFLAPPFSTVAGDPAVSYIAAPQAPAAGSLGALTTLSSSQPFRSASSTDCPPFRRPPPATQAASGVHDDSLNSSFEDGSGGEEGGHRDELDSSAGSRAAQAALDAAEELIEPERQFDSSPALTALTRPSFSANPPMALERIDLTGPLPPQPVEGCRLDAEMDNTRSDSTPRDEMASGADCVLHTPSPYKQRLFPRTNGDDFTGIPVNAAHAAVSRRQPPPPPTPSTTRRASPSCSSAMRCGGGSETTSCDRSFFTTEPTVEQQNTPLISHGTHTNTTSAEAAQAVVNYSASLLPPTRSTSSSSNLNDKGGSSGSARGGPDAGNDSPGLAFVRNAPGRHHNTRSSSDSSGGDTYWLQLPCETAMEHSGALEEAVGADNTASATVLTSSLTAIDTVMGESGTSSSRTSVVLMPPLPPQPRVASPPDHSSHPPSLSVNADAAVFGTSPSCSYSDEDPPAPERLAAGRPPGGDAVQQMLVTQRIPAPGNSLLSRSSSSKSIGGTHKEPRQPIRNRSRSVTSGELTDREEVVGDDDRPTPPSHAVNAGTVAGDPTYTPPPVSVPVTAPQMDAVRERVTSARRPRAPPHTRVLDIDDFDRGEESEEGSTCVNWDDAEEGGSNPAALEEAGRWDRILGEMELVDCTMISRVHQQVVPRQRSTSHSSSDDGGVHADTEDGEDLCLFKVVSLFPMAAEDCRARWPRRARVQRCLLALAEEMRSTQRALDEAGLTSAESETQSPDSQGVDAHEAAVSAKRGRVDGVRDDPNGLFAQRRQRTTCAGLLRVHVDSSCRLIAQLEATPYMVTLRYLLAASAGTGLRENEVVALIRTVVCKVATMHNAGFVHGALHAGNVLISSYDGDAVLTQPCGLMSQSSWLPSDLSAISVSRALAMAPYISKVWGAHRLHFDGSTSRRLGSPQRPSTAELITYHNLAALGWLDGDPPSKSAESDDSDNITEPTSGVAYTPTAADDLYAVGMIAFFIHFGAPPFQMASLWAVVERLGVLLDDYMAAMQSCSCSSSVAARQEARRVVAEFCFGTGRYSFDAKCASSPSPSSAESPQSPGLTTPALSVMRHHSVTPFRAEFVEALQSFIVDCVEASCIAAMQKCKCAPPHPSGPSQPVYANAQELLAGHPFFRRPSLSTQTGDGHGAHGDTGGGPSTEEEELQSGADEKMRDTVHRVAYPAFCTWSGARKDCGSVPYLSRLHSNALFTARCTALCAFISFAAQHDNDRTSDSLKIFGDSEPLGTLSLLSPQVVVAPRAWRASFPSGAGDTGCGGDRKTGQHTFPAASAETTLLAPLQWQQPGNPRLAVDSAEHQCLSSLIRPSPVEAPAWVAVNDHDGCSDNNVSAGASAQEGEGDLVAQIFSGSPPGVNSNFVYRPLLHALVLAEKQEDVFFLSRTFILSRVSPFADTLVLQHLTDCTVTLLAPFRYVVLDGLQRCEVRLGPCESCVLRDVHNCPLIAVAARQLCGINVSATHLSWSGQGSGRSHLKSSRDVTTSLYGLVYEGVVEDYSRVGLALEHAPCFAPMDNADDLSEASATAGSRIDVLDRRRTVELLPNTATDASQSQIEVGLCLAPEAPYAHALFFSNTRYVHSGRRSGGLESASVPLPDVYHFFGELTEKDVVVCDIDGSVQDGDARPIVFLIGVLGDVVVERCSYCTIVVAGTPSSLQASECHDCELIFMARESVIEDCARVDCVALVTEYLLVRECDAVRVRPLFLDCPFSDEILRCVVGGSIGGSEEEKVVGAYKAGRLHELNAVLRGFDQGVYVETSENVFIEDISYYYQHSGLARGIERNVSRNSGADKHGISLLSVPYASMPNPTAGGGPSNDASQFTAKAAQSLAEHLSLPCYLEPLHRYGDVEREAVSRASRVAVSFHDLLNVSVFRPRGSLCPVASHASSGSPDTAAPLVDVCVDRIHGGVIYIEDAVHNLRLRHCAGPLDVVVCAAATVYMEGCVGVQLRTACIDFHAVDCVHCHVALHVNNPPRYHCCTSMQTSALNITARDLDTMLAAAGVSLATNLYDSPLPLTEKPETRRAVGFPSASLETRAIDGSCRVDVDTPTAFQGIADICAALVASTNTEQRVSPSQIPRIMSVLRQPVTVVAPLPGLCVSPTEAPFLEELEERVVLWAKQPLSVSREEAVAIALYALADVGEASSSVTEWAEGSELGQHTEPPPPGAEVDTAPDADEPLPLVVIRAPPSPSATTTTSTVDSAPEPASGAAQQRSFFTDPQSQQQTEHCHPRDSGDVAAQSAPALLTSSSSGVVAVSEAVVDKISPGLLEKGQEGDSMKGEATMHPAPEPPLSPPLTHYVDPMQVPLSTNTCTSPVAEPRVTSMQFPRAHRTEGSPMRTHVGGDTCFAPTATLHAASSANSSSVTGHHDIASSTEIDISVNSSDTAPPPPPPGPTDALNPTQVGASSAMNVFSHAQQSGLSVTAGATDPVMGNESGAYVAATCASDREDLGLPSASPFYGHSRSAAMGGDTSSVGHDSTWMEPQPLPVDEAFGALGGEVQVRWPSLSQASMGLLISAEGNNRGGDEPMAALVPKEGEQHCAGNTGSASSRGSSSPTAEYLRGDLTQCESNTKHIEGKDSGAVAGALTLAPTGALHVSQDSPTPQQNLSFPDAIVIPLKAMDATGGDDAEVGDPSTICGAVLEPQPNECIVRHNTDSPEKTFYSEVITTDDLAVEMQDLTRRVEQARQLYTQQQGSWQSAASGSLEARVRAAVAKLGSLKKMC
ncbi:hypothetical protein JKF63_05777 [Porcisia hertigi]|uniref:C-CAP/cofactor C-like domain-containing protein n=1 Tax=Porcisia hertigi TaxID=2761500 RepID=A0A836I973_9TRYP|nr:hypothetical protein JKF63_05777 [Porcisia hertigi]